MQLRESTIRADASTVPDELVDLHARLGLVGLTTHEDRAYCHEHARTIYRGEGQIVELGCWLGSLTSALALGLEENPAPTARNKVVHAHDRFVWTEWMDTLPPELNPNGLRAGERFRSSFETQVEPWRERIAIHEGDLLQLGWQGGPIEFLVVDAMKSWELTAAIARHFYPRLVPGRSFVFQQDFAHEAHPWIQLLTFRLRHFFEPVNDVIGSDALVFRLERPLPQPLLEGDGTWAAVDPTELEAAFAYSLELVSPPKRPALEAGLARALKQL